LVRKSSVESSIQTTYMQSTRHRIVTPQRAGSSRWPDVNPHGERLHPLEFGSKVTQYGYNFGLIRQYSTESFLLTGTQ
jgi:hypothetical protein